MAKYVAEVNVDMECWITNPDAVEGGYIKGVCTAVNGDSFSIKVGDKTLTGDNENVFPAEPESNPAVPDNCGLMYLNEATMLENLKRRFMNDEIYTFTANILIAINPYKDMSGVYTGENIKRYQGMSIGALDPHIYAIGDKSYRDMRNLGLSQCILCSGESGAGKTESTKHLLRYLTDSYGGGGDVADLESRILAANPLLESFGNAKTTRNNNSSRFGKFVELHFNRNYKVIGAHILHYLLEKSRVISQNNEERNYHVFYRIIRGAPEAMRKALDINTDASTYNYVKQSMLEDIRGLDDKKDFAMMERAMTDCGLTPDEKSNVFRITTAVLHIGNLQLEDSGDGCRIANDDVVATVCRLLGLDTDKFKEAMCFKTIQIGKQESLKALSTLDAGFSKNGLGKSLYSKLFDWIIERANECFPFPKDRSVNYIGILDIAGFEYFKHNSFEQFCINYCNEKLQQFFNERVLKDEQELYVKESIKFKQVEFVDNQDCIDLIETSKTGVLAILDEQSKLPKASDTSFAEMLHTKHGKHIRLQVPRKSKMSWYKQLRDNEGFIVRHFAGAVCYEVDGFMDKNNDALTSDLAQLMESSKDKYLRTLFEHKPGDPKIQKGKLTLISLGDKFKKALTVLMEKLHSTRASFIRCIKPNQQMKPKVFSGGEILSQLQCAGMVSVLDLMQGGYPSRTLFKDLYDMYKAVLPPELAALDPRTFAKALFKALGMNEDDFQFGVSRVFFRPGKFAEFDTIMKSDPENLVKLVEKVLSWLVKQRWKKIAWACVSSLKFASKIRARGTAAIIMQRVVKMFIARRQHAPRARGFAGLKKLESQVTDLFKTVEKFPKNKEKMQAQVQSVLDDLKKTCASVQSDASMTAEQVKKLETAMNAQIDKQLASIKKEQEKQKMAEEAERLRKIAQQMEEERRKKQEEEERQKAELAEMEARKKMEAEQKKLDEEAAREEEKARIKAEKESKDTKVIEAEKARKRAAMEEAAQLEQERRDQELAMRLAMDHAGADGNTSHVLSDEAKAQAATGQAKRRKAKAGGVQYNFGNKKQEALHKKHDLSKWKYADLRDTINTSCDVDLLEACREEFHRRLKVYHAWKMKNQNKAQTKSEARAPEALQSAAKARGAAPPPPSKKKKDARPQRFFRMPFVRQEDRDKGGVKGWWFAHFDGQWIARQMELHPQKPPVLLVAGRDDMEMCELSLDESGLPRKRGAEILPREFEDEWAKCGGEPYVANRK
eukprot:m.501224 g.501224  ORF g.501224 m.501224 type:complete len:1234 (-) comp21837_c1_seq13:181-3882(-)